MKHLLSRPCALPFLLAVFMNAFVDLGHKIIIQNTILKMYSESEQIMLTAVVNGLILLPFIILFSPAGWVSDRFPKHQVMRLSAWAAVVLTLLITVFYSMGWFWLAFAMTFLLAVQSAFYSPAKFGYLKGFFGTSRLAQANGVAQAISIVAILVGTFAFSILFEMWFPVGATVDTTDKGVVLKALVPAGGLLVLSSVIELWMTYRLPNVEATNTKADSVRQAAIAALELPQKPSSIFTQLVDILSNRTIRLSIIGLAMFWSVGQVMLVTFPAFAKTSLGEINTIVIQGILAATGVGIALGSVIAGRCSKHHIETGLIPLGALGIAVGLLWLPSLSSGMSLALTFLWIGVMGGLFIVPLNALIQFHANPSRLGETLAANNLIQNTAMLSFLVLTVLLSSWGISSQQLLQTIAVVALVGGLYTVITLPQSLIRFLLTFCMSRHYKVNVQGMANIPESGGVLLLGNHMSFVDWAIVQIACPRSVRFVMHKSIYDVWYLRWFLKLFGCVPITSGASSQKSLESVANLLNQGEVVCLFPEGLLSRTGHLAAFRKGYERAAELADDYVAIVPFYLHGLWGSQFSRSESRTKPVSDRWGREVIVAFGERLGKSTPATELKSAIFDLSMTAWHRYTDNFDTIDRMWIDQVKRKPSSQALADASGGELSAGQALIAASALAKRISNISSAADEQSIGILLPSSMGGMLTNMAGLLAGKTLVNLNYTAGVDALNAAVDEANIQTIYTSPRFIQQLSKKGITLDAVLQRVRVVDVASLKADISKIEMLSRWLCVQCLPASVLKALWSSSKDPEQAAAILFSSGSEGKPKGVLLSHHNIVANCKQVSAVINTQAGTSKGSSTGPDKVMASLPLFHAFGLTVTQFMPLLEGLPVVCHPDPTDVLAVAKAVSTHKVTMLFGTSTLLRLYSTNKKIHPLMLDSLRLVVAGAERLAPEVSERFTLKFNKAIYEGYGATETSPVACVNLPDQMDPSNYQLQKGGKNGTVGMPLPGTRCKIVDPRYLDGGNLTGNTTNGGTLNESTLNETSSELIELPVNEHGMILIAGVQLMQGYLNQPEKTAAVIKVIDGVRWYVTGDKGYIDDDGYVTIVDRYSRFAKVGGEMISLSAVEQAVTNAWHTMYDAKTASIDDLTLMAVNISDEKKGERIVILSSSDCDLMPLRKTLLSQTSQPLMQPSDWIVVDQLPQLGAGKLDVVAAKKIAMQQ